MNKDDITHILEPFLNKTFLFYINVVEDGYKKYKEHEVTMNVIHEETCSILQLLTVDGDILATSCLIENSRVFFKIAICGNSILINDSISLIIKR